MYREYNTIGIRSTPYQQYCDITSNRTKRSRQAINDDIFSINDQIYQLKQAIDHRPTPELKAKLKKATHKRDLLQAELNAKNNGDTRHKPLKQRRKKQDLNKLEPVVTDLILALKAKNVMYTTKEDVAHFLHAKVSQIELIFMHLNQKGLLSQPEHRAMHDGQRDPWGYTSSDWCSDKYYIL